MINREDRFFMMFRFIVVIVSVSVIFLNRRDFMIKKFFLYFK